MSSAEKDLLYLQASLPEVKKYLFSDILYYPLMGNFPRLTIGGLLLAQRRLGDEKRAARLNAQLASLISSWRASWAKKSAIELKARLRLWSNYLKDYRNAPDEYASDYPIEVRWRVMIELLIPEAENNPAEIEVLDQLVKANFSAGKFIWDEKLQDKFSSDKYWYLYGKLK